jgi:catechol 2,3-dioxygenase-like lactoylglutathione lyase family enzyme
MRLRKLTPILYVEEIESALPFWTDRLGFRVATEVPEGDRLGFVILEREGLELMVQSRASVQADLPALADTPRGASILFIEVAALDPILEAIAGVPVVVPRRTTFYGADEVFVREPGGNLVGFAAFGAEATASG